MLGPIAVIQADVSADGEFTGDQDVNVQAEAGTRGIRLKNGWNLSISGTWTGRVTVQRSFDNGTSWKDINGYTANIEEWDEEEESGILYRVGFKTGDYGSGTAELRLSR